MCGIILYCVYKQSRSCQLPFCASPIFHFEIGDFSVYTTKIHEVKEGCSTFGWWAFPNLARGVVISFF